ncbi:hypothetical protein LOTGIDRAFT_204918 [Lottia gigantea]|uniref:Mitochondrial GTPase 1 n=1 Tax=Lottia gigantea TaxID=225164 RepID=V3ZDT7_LOTGI|nr:hypothetical protein LOTGIDRAFT_204918 [Lottia gigantea]ESO82212.1 hypothetical protein LOTGIDRAFT_204918 [Lottia gigantea]
MSRKVFEITKTFRTKFEATSDEVLRWFPGHMFKSMERIQAVLKDIDCVIEVHDAKIPFSGRNPRFRDFINLRPHILLLNKYDLADINVRRKELIENKLKTQGVDTIFYTDLRTYEKSPILKDHILPTAIELTNSRPRYQRQGNPEYNILVIGVPNVGKSTFINAIRWSHIKTKGRATQVGAVAGITRSLLNKIMVHNNPVTYVFDTPGILTPSIPNVDAGMKLAICRCIPDKIVGPENMSDYLLFWLNSHQRFDYVDFYGLKEPIDNVYDFLAEIAIINNKINKSRNQETSNEHIMVPNFEWAANKFLKDFRNGRLGQYFLDDNELMVKQTEEISKN